MGMGHWRCSACEREVRSNPIACDLCFTARPGMDPELGRLAGQRDLIMEAHFAGLGLWMRVGGLLMAAVGLWIGIGALVAARGPAMGIVVFGAFYGVLLLGMGGGLFALGHFVARRDDAARIVAGVFTALGLALQLLGWAAAVFLLHALAWRGADPARTSLWELLGQLVYLAWSASVLWLLFNRRAAALCTLRYRELVARTHLIRAPWHKSAFFLLPCFALALFGLFYLTVVVRSSLH